MVARPADRAGAGRRRRPPRRRRAAGRRWRATSCRGRRCSTSSRRGPSISTTIPMPSLDDLEGYCGETSSALIRLASPRAGRRPRPRRGGGGGTCGRRLRADRTAARAALARVARAGLPAGRPDAGPWRHTRRHRIRARQPGPARSAGAMRAIARGHLGETRARIGSVNATIAPAFLPLALVSHLSRPHGQARLSPVPDRGGTARLAQDLAALARGAAGLSRRGGFVSPRPGLRPGQSIRTAVPTPRLA